MSALRTIAVAALAFAAAPAAAAGPPQLDVSKTCNASTDVAGREKKFCIDDEAAAKTFLVKAWSSYKPADVTRCTGIVQSGGPPSYVELQLCLEAARMSTATRTGGPSILHEGPLEEPKESASSEQPQEAAPDPQQEASSSEQPEERNPATAIRNLFGQFFGGDSSKK